MKNKINPIFILTMLLLEIDFREKRSAEIAMLRILCYNIHSIIKLNLKEV